MSVLVERTDLIGKHLFWQAEDIYLMPLSLKSISLAIANPQNTAHAINIFDDIDKYFVQFICLIISLARQYASNRAHSATEPHWYCQLLLSHQSFVAKKQFCNEDKYIL